MKSTSVCPLYSELRQCDAAGPLDCLEARVRSGKFSAEIDILCRKLALKMFPVRTDYVDGQIGSPTVLNFWRT